MTRPRLVRSGRRRSDEDVLERLDADFTMKDRLIALVIGMLLAGALATPAGAIAGDITTIGGGNGQGSGQEFLKKSYGAVVDSVGNLYIADTYNHRVQKVDSNGTITTVAGTGIQGSTQDQLNHPFAIAVDNADNIYIADTINSRIQKLDTNGTITTVAGIGGQGSGESQLDNPYGLSVDSAGSLYITDTLNSRVQKVDTNGTITTVAGTGGRGTGQTQLDWPWAATVDSDGTLYVADTMNSRVQRIDTNGTITTVAGTGGNGSGAAQLDMPADLALDSVGNLYIADANNHRIQRLESNGTVTTAAGINGQGSGQGQLSRPYGISIDANDNIYIMDTYNYRVLRIEGTDAVAPTVVISSPTDGAVVSSGAALTAEFVCDDSFTGISSCNGTLDGEPIESGGLIHTGAAGTNTLTVTATDIAGNTSTTSVTFTVETPPATVPTYGAREITGVHADSSGTRGTIARLYMATFKRQPDSAGHAYWLDRATDDIGLLRIIDHFVSSPEFSTAYDSLTSRGFVEQLYLNVMNRSGEDAGIDFWTEVIESGAGQARVLLMFSESPEFKLLTRTS